MKSIFGNYTDKQDHNLHPVLEYKLILYEHSWPFRVLAVCVCVIRMLTAQMCFETETVGVLPLYSFPASKVNM